MSVVYLNGLTCLGCGECVYNGYAGNNTMPCPNCGDVQPAMMSVKEFRKRVGQRDGSPPEFEIVLPRIWGPLRLVGLRWNPSYDGISLSMYRITFWVFLWWRR